MEKTKKENWEQEGFAASVDYVHNPPETPAFSRLSYAQIGRIYAFFATKQIEDKLLRRQAERDFHMGWKHELD